MLLELSHKYASNIPTFPGNPSIEFLSDARTKKGDAWNATTIRLPLHNGTHVDAPFHFHQSGQTIDQIPIDDFYYTCPILIECPAGEGELLGTELLANQMNKVYKADLLLFHTGYGELRQNQPAIYAGNFPSLSLELAQLLRTELPRLKGIAIDVLSVESIHGYKNKNIVHHTLLSDIYPQRPLLLFEDVHTGLLSGKICRAIYAFPLRLEGLDASPVAIVADVEELS